MLSVPERVRELIRTSGLSQRAFAEGIGLDDSKMSKSLSGARRFTSLDLARIAELSHVTVDWLISGKVPVLATAGRTAGGGAATAIAEAKRLSVLRSDMTFLGYPQPWRPIRVTPGNGRYIDGGAELAAAAIRRVRSSGATEADPDLADLIERAFGIDVCVADLGKDFDGLAISSDEVKLILVGKSQIPARQRFTLAHELGHLLAGDDQELHLDQDVYDQARKRDPSELRANAFAAAFLMPDATLRAAVGSTGLTESAFAALALDVGVSPSALAYRLSGLRLIDAGTCDRFRSVTAKKAADLANRGEDFAHRVMAAGRARPPGLLVRDAYAAYNSGVTTLRPYAALIGVDVESLRSALESELPAAET